MTRIGLWYATGPADRPFIAYPVNAHTSYG